MNAQILETVPIDCLHGIFSFLPIQECLAFGSTSIKNLIEIQPELRLRRKRFTQTFVYNSLIEYPKACGPINLATMWKTKGNRDIHLLPTVRDRIETLHKILPNSHPLATSVLDLLRAIRDIHNDDAKHKRETKDLPRKSLMIDFQSAFDAHKKLILPHKSHSILLAQSIQSNPVHCDRGYRHGISGGSHSNDGNVLTVTLERYVGDVLCAFYLMGHSAASIIDGGPTENDWIDAIEAELPCLTTAHWDEFEPKAPLGVTASTWYRCWIFVQSTLLRIAHFTWGQQIQLGIASPMPTSSSSQGILDVSEGSLLRPHKPFAGCEKSSIMRRLTLVTNFGPLRVTFNDFGPLGPSFRGRDLIQSHTIYPATTMGVIIYFDGLNPEEYAKCTQGPIPSFLPFLRNWSASQDTVIQWLLELHTESSKSRPMTVAPPLVTIKCF